MLCPCHPQSRQSARAVAPAFISLSWLGSGAGSGSGAGAGSGSGAGAGLEAEPPLEPLLELEPELEELEPPLLELPELPELPALEEPLLELPPLEADSDFFGAVFPESTDFCALSAAT